MTRTTAVLAAAAALAAAGRAFPGQDAPRKDEMELKCVAVPSRGRPHIRLEGQAPTLPEGARLSINLIRIEERISEGRLIVGGEFYHSEITAVDRKGRIAYSCAVGGPGYFRAVVKLSEEIQGARSLDALKKAKTLMPQEWTFDYTAWGDELAGRLSPALQEFDALAGQATALVGKYAEASAQRALWEASRNALDRESARLLNDISKSEAKSTAEPVRARRRGRSRRRSIRTPPPPATSPRPWAPSRRPPTSSRSRPTADSTRSSTITPPGSPPSLTGRRSSTGTR